jgi:GNAT superfamily N-acetyltransferase
MKIYKLSQANIVFNNEFLASYSGQQNFKLNAELNGIVVGWVDYSIYNEDLYINIVEVVEEYRRTGIGTKLLKELQRRFPDKAFEMGTFTEQGSKLWESLPKKVIINEEYKKLIEEKTTLEQKNKKLSKQLHNIPFANLQTPEQRIELENLGEQLNLINDRLFQIDEEIYYDIKPEYIYVDFEQ